MTTTPEQSHRYSALRQIWIPLGSLLLAALGLLARETPSWVSAAILTYVAIVLCYLLIPLVKDGISAHIKKRRERSIAESFYPRLLEFASTLSIQFEDMRADTIYAVWRMVGGWEQAKPRVEPDFNHLRTLNAWLRSIESRARDNDWRQFRGLIGELHELVVHYHNTCEAAQRQLGDLAQLPSLPPQLLRTLKQEWNGVRDGHNHLIRTWAGILNGTDFQSGDDRPGYHFSQLRTIE